MTAGPSERWHLDHNAGTPVDPRVLERFLEVERACPGNPASLHTAGRRARAVLEEARCEAAQALGVQVERILFLSGGTEANNLVVRGAGDPEAPVLLAPTEHPSVLDPARERGVVQLAVDEYGHASIAPPDRKVGLLCLVHAQSELGTIQPVATAAELAAALGVPLHVDAAQSAGRIPIDDVLAVATTVTLSAHKLGGLRGASVLVHDPSRPMRPLLRGGGQEGGLRPGTVSPSLAAATARALTLALAEQTDRARAMAAAREAFLEELQNRVRVRSLTPDDSIPNTLMLAFPDADSKALLPALDLAGVHASAGSACSAGSPKPPRILREILEDEALAARCVRFSFSHRTTPDSARLAARAAACAIARISSG